MTTPHYVGRLVYHDPAPVKPTHVYVDPWRALCEHCRFFDCIRTEGDISPAPTNRGYPGCRIYDAAAAGLTPEQALQEAERER